MGKSKKLGRPTKRKGPEPIAPAVWERIRREVERGALDRIHGSELGRLSYQGQITSTQFAAGNRVGQIYGVYERLIIGKARSSRSPSYDSGYTGGGGVDVISLAAMRSGKTEAELTSEILGNFDKLQEHIPQGYARNIIESVCVEDRQAGVAWLDYLRAILDNLAQYFGIVSAGKKSNPTLAKKANGAAAPVVAAPRVNIERECWSKVVRRMIPNMQEDAIDKAFSVYVALRERERFRSQKERAKKDLLTTTAAIACTEPKNER